VEGKDGESSATSTNRKSILRKDQSHEQNIQPTTWGFSIMLSFACVGKESQATRLQQFIQGKFEVHRGAGPEDIHRKKRYFQVKFEYNHWFARSSHMSKMRAF
jgi:hypothetical protein